MNTNISTLRRIRRTHAKFTALTFNPSTTTGAEDGVTAPPLETPLEADDLKDDLSEPDTGPWVQTSISAAGAEVGEHTTEQYLRWMDRKVLEHVGFQGMSIFT